MKSKFRLLLAVLSVAAASAAPVSAEVVRIAYIDPLSGPFGAQGASLLQHFQFVAERANQEKWAGEHKLEVVGFDNKASPQESISQLKAAIDQGYRYITQGGGSGAGLALIDAINKHNERNPGKEIVYLNHGAQDPDLTNSKCSFWHFRFLDNSDMKLEALTTYMAKDQMIKKVYLIGQDYAYGQQISKSAKQYLALKRPDIKIAGDDLHPIGQVKDFSPYVAKIKVSGADVVVTGNWGQDFTLLIKAAKDAGLNIPFYAFSAIQYGAATPVGASGVGRLMSMFPWHANNEVSGGLDYVDAYKKKYKEDFFFMTPRTILAMLGQGIKDAKSNDPIKVAFAMEGMKIKGPVGDIEMRKQDHQVQQPLYILSWSKANTKEVKHDMENTGFGWKTEKKIDAYVAAQPTSCQMTRPARS